MDVKSTFLDGDLYELIFMEKTPCFVIDSNLSLWLESSSQSFDPSGSQWPSTFSTQSTFQACGFDKP
jgi:hypothetical protein